MYIYCITNNITKQVYIGQTVNFVCDNIIVFKSLRKAVEYFNLPLHNTAKIAKACKGLIPNPVFNHTWRYGNKLTK